MTDLLEQLMYEPVYDTLRTKEQLGYTVGAGLRNTMGVLGFCVVVQSAAYGVEHCTSRVEAFLVSNPSETPLDPLNVLFVAGEPHADLGRYAGGGV